MTTALSEIYFYVDEKGQNPVRDLLQSLPRKERGKISAYVTALKIHGHNLRRPMADYLGGGIYELRPRSNRIFYFFFMRNNAVLLHAIKKKTDKIPTEDLALCLKRKESVRSEKDLMRWSQEKTI